MTDREIIQQVKAVKEKENALVDAQIAAGEKMEWVEKKYEAGKFSLVGTLLISFFAACVIGGIAALLLNTSSILALVIPFVIVAALCISGQRSAKKEFTTEIAPQIPEIKQAYDEAVQALKHYQESKEYTDVIPGAFPAKYSDPASLAIIIDYFDTRRADTLKEAFNLLESEAKMNELMNLQKKQLDEMAKNNAAAQQIVQQNERMAKLNKQIAKSSKWTNWWLFWK